MVSNQRQDKGMAFRAGKPRKLWKLQCFNAEETKDGTCTGSFCICLCTGIWKVSATTYVIIYCSSTMRCIFRVSYGHTKYLHKQIIKKTPNHTFSWLHEFLRETSSFSYLSGIKTPCWIYFNRSETTACNFCFYPNWRWKVPFQIYGNNASSVLFFQLAYLLGGTCPFHH